MKKTYSKPQIKTEKFTPQEYCNPCTTPFNHQTTATAYYDLNRDGNFDSGAHTIPSMNYKDIQIYYLQRATSNGNSHDFVDYNGNVSVGNNQSYSGIFKISGRNYTFRPGPTVNIVDGRLYMNAS